MCLAKQGQQTVLHVVGSFVTKDTYETAQYLQRTYGNQLVQRRLTCYPDASGGNKSTSSTKTDHQILRESGINVQSERRNPPPPETFAHCNVLFHRNLLRVNTNAAPQTTESLERWSYDERGNPQKGGENDYSHGGDAFRYVVWGSMGGANRTMRRGIQVYG